MNNYGMFTDAGNQAVADLIQVAKKLNMTWPEVYRALCKLSENDNFREATDTVVRECVYDACGFTSDFYIL